MKTISIEVSDSAAERFLLMPESAKKNLSKMFTEIVEDKRTILEVMEDIGEYARKQGLTQEKLDELLRDE